MSTKYHPLAHQRHQYSVTHNETYGGICPGSATSSSVVVGTSRSGVTKSAHTCSCGSGSIAYDKMTGDDICRCILVLIDSIKGDNAIDGTTTRRMSISSIERNMLH